MTEENKPMTTHHGVEVAWLRGRCIAMLHDDLPDDTRSEGSPE